MKKLLYFTIIFSTFSFLANHEDLKQAIIKSNLAQIKEILNTTKLPKEEIPSLTGMAQNIVDRRRGDEKIAYIPQIALAIPGLILNILTLPMVTLGAVALPIAIIREKSFSKPFKAKPNSIKAISFAGLVNITGLSMLYGSYKIFKLTHKWHDDAVEIKQLIKANASRF